jgi:hypothetical protein
MRTAPDMKRIVARVVQLLTTLIVFIALGGVVVLQLWNWLVPPLVGLPEITFWQGLGILALCRILFGGSGDPTRRRRREPRPTTDLWQRLSPEEQERLRQSVAGGAPSTGQ